MSQIPSQCRSLILLSITLLLLSGCSGDGGEVGGSTGAACQSNCPTARAGPEQVVLTGDAVTLDGSGSTSGTPGLITYHWTLQSKPTGSAATLANATTARPTFTADVAGSYTARLVVQEGGVSSPPATVTITCGSGNLAPIADAGPDRTDCSAPALPWMGPGVRIRTARRSPMLGAL
jgi:chitinase